MKTCLPLPMNPCFAWTLAALSLLAALMAGGCSDTGTATGQGTAASGGMDLGGLLDSGTLDTGGLDTGGFDPGSLDTGASDAAAVDTGTGDSGAKDSGGQDTSSKDVNTAADFGKPCKSDSDCASGWCIEGYSGYFCTQTCAGQCPKNHVCQKVFAGDKQGVFLCVAPVNKLCKPCGSDLDCSGGACVTSGAESFCADPCGAGQAPCPGSHQCQPITNPDGTPGPQVCMPKTGSCSCTAASPGLVRACQQSSGPTSCYGIEVCQAGKWGACQLPGENCNGQDDDCDGVIDNGFVDNNGAYTTLQACGQCGINCQVLQGAHAKPACSSNNGAAKCQLICDTNWFDTNDNPKDGCECGKVGSVDQPDGPDQNCDGIDGEVDNGVFVALTGKDIAAGTQAAPLATIAAGIAKAKQLGKRDVYVATGVYAGSLALVAEVHVYGGYSADFKAHDPQAYETVVFGSAFKADQPGAVNAIGLLGSKATLDGFTVFGASTKVKGASTYAIYVRDCDAGLRLRGNKVIAGDAAGGKPGTAGGNGAAGSPGTAGGNAKDIGTAACLTTTHATLGGKGGVHTCGGSDVSGGGGGKAICPDYDEDGTQPKSSPYKQTLSAAEQGLAGKGNSGGKGGASGYDSLIWEGSSSACGICVQPKFDDSSDFLSGTGLNGADGGDGALGAAGGGCDGQTGKVAGGVWQVGSAGDGLAGAAGSGGGGGGAGGGVETSVACKTNPAFKFPDVGGSGGGAGAGGCGATGGSAGGSGGGSFALFLTFSAVPATLPQIADNLLVTGNGGDGGPGGQGGVGGLGGDGKFGGGDDPAKLAWCASAGGRGGQGGNGGHGGGGGGGCGGVSFGIFLSGTGAVDANKLATANTVQVLGVPGLGGAGGKSLGKGGGDGGSGSGGAVNW